MVLEYLFKAGLLFISLISLSISSSKNLGQKDFDLYYGTEFPLVRYSQYSFRATFKDERDNQNYFSQKISPQLFMLENYFGEEYLIGNSCPDVIYDKHKDYIHFLFRLLKLSYLFDGLRSYEYVAKQFKLKSTCQFNWSEKIKQCNPKTIDMKVFKNNFLNILDVLDSVSVPFDQTSKSYLTNWFKKLKSGSLDIPLQYRLTQDVKKKLTTNNIHKNLDSICKDDLNIFLKICSEEDSFFGSSDIKELYKVLSSSSSVNIINKLGFAKGCLSRFVWQNKNKEIRLKNQSKVFSFIYETYQDKPNLEGRLFSLGAMREFTEKGITDIFEFENDNQKKSVTKKVVTKSLPLPKFEIIKLPKFKKIKVKKRIVKEKIIKKTSKKSQISSFQKSVNFLKKFNLDSVNVDLDKFKYDYLFTVRKQKKLEPVVNRFGRFSALKDMKDNDQLGSKSAPVPLIYLKFLLESKKDQLLFNLVNVLGNDFFVINDIDKNINEPIKVKLFNNLKSNYTWKLDILDS